jgi:hypothetical protein
MRKDFAPKDKVKLAQRSGYICSYPSCESLTIAPSEEGSARTSSVGMACHIYAASEGLNAKRTNLNLTDEQVADISNGIWMCYTHGKLIDTDDVRFTPKILQEWKEISESITTLRQDTGIDYKTAYTSLKLDKFVENEITLPKEFGINKLVGDALHDSCLSIAWGKEVTESLRDFLIEHIRNSYLHGQASYSSLAITSNGLVITDDGAKFDPRTLHTNKTKRGGSRSIQYLLNNHGNKIFISSHRKQTKNILKISIPETVEDVESKTPCVLNFEMSRLHQGNVSYKIKESCNEVFIILPEYFGLSDIAFLSLKHPAIHHEKRHLIFVLRWVSGHVKELLEEQFNGCQVLELNENV